MILSPFFWCTSWLKITIMIFHFAPIASTLSTSKEFLHWEWRDCMHIYCVMECTHEILAGFFFVCGFFFLIFTLLLTVSQHKTCDVYIFINSTFASKGNINQGGKFWNIESPLFFIILCFDSYLHVFPRIMASMYVREGWYTQTRKRLKNSHLVVYISLSQ